MPSERVLDFPVYCNTLNSMGASVRNDWKVEESKALDILTLISFA